jgi:phosphonate transport system ATP-binding protein
VTGLALSLEQLAVRHPAARDGAPPALQDFSVTVAPGEQVAVIGPSGAGKTTLLHAAACALKPGAGRLQLGGQDVWSLNAAALRRLRAQLFLAPQTPPLPPRQRVVTAVLAARLPELGLGASLWSLLRPQHRQGSEQAHAALQRFDLGDKLWERVDRLSGGERQRVGLARALVAPASLWLIDEPLSALDPTRAQQALRALTGAAQARGATLLATLHQVELALAHFPRVLGLRDGRLVFDLPAAEVTRERLTALYQSFEHELAGGLPASHLPDGPADRVLQMACR